MAEKNVEYLSLAQWAKLHGKDRRNALRLIQEGRIPAQKIGSQWAIAADVQPPPDKRVKTGKYKGWRNKANTPPKDQ